MSEYHLSADDVFINAMKIFHSSDILMGQMN